MVLKFFSYNSVNPEPGGLAYLLKNDTARVVRGNPKITQAVIDASPPRLEHRYTAGVLNGCPPMGTKQEQALIDELEIQLLAGRARESMLWSVIAHGEGEKHFVIPNFDPVFDKVVHPYVDRIDRHGLRAWVEHYSLRKGLPLPNDRLRIEPGFSHMRITKEDVEFLQQIWECVKFWVTRGLMKTRDELLPLLSGAGYIVRCDKHAGGRLAQPVVVGPRGNLLRLTGSTYYRPDFGRESPPMIDPNDPEYLSKRLAVLHEKVTKRLDFRAWHLIGRLFGSDEQSRVVDGASKKHIHDLIQEKLRSEMRALRAFPPVNLAHLIKVADAHKAGLQPVILIKKAVGQTVVPATPVEEDAPPFVVVKPVLIRAEDDSEEHAPPVQRPPADDEVTPVDSADTGKLKRSKKRRQMQIELDDMGLPLKGNKPLHAPDTSKPLDVNGLPLKDEKPTGGT